MGRVYEDEHCRVEIDGDGQGTTWIRGSETLLRAYWACGHCGEATGGSGHACPDHPHSLRFLKYDRIPAA